jgi:hypothetical protein
MVLHIISLHHLPLLPPASLLLPAHHCRRRSCPLLLLPLSCTQRGLLPQIHPHDILNTTPVVLDSPHVRQARASRPLGRTLHNLDALDQWTVNLVPHFDAHARELATQENRRVGTPAPDVNAYTGKRVARALAHKQDIADTRALWVVLCEEPGSCTSGVQHAYLRGCHRRHRVRTRFLDVAGRWLEDGNAELVAWSVEFSIGDPFLSLVAEREGEEAYSIHDSRSAASLLLPTLHLSAS